MRLTAKSITARLHISREAFYKNNRKTQVFTRISRGVYEVDEETFNTMVTYYGLKSGFNLWKSMIHADKQG